MTCAVLSITAVLFNLFFEVEPFATSLTAHITSCNDDSCIGNVA